MLFRSQAGQDVVRRTVFLGGIVPVALDGHRRKAGEVVDQRLVVRRHRAHFRVVHAEHAEQAPVGGERLQHLLRQPDLDEPRPTRPRS